MRNFAIIAINLTKFIQKLLAIMWITIIALRTVLVIIVQIPTTPQIQIQIQIQIQASEEARAEIKTVKKPVINLAQKGSLIFKCHVLSPLNHPR